MSQNDEKVDEKETVEQSTEKAAQSAATEQPGKTEDATPDSKAIVSDRFSNLIKNLQNSELLNPS